MKWFKLGLFLVIFSIFIYLRLTPILNQTVPYTYDQGRDFLKAEEIVRFHNLTFIGPTTGIMGLYHGAWWYYLLTIPYFFFNGWPMGFYYFMFLISTIGNLAFFAFLKKEFNFNTALLFLAIVSVSPYFIPLSFFASNNIITPYVILLLIAGTYYLFKTKNYFWLFLTALSLGFIHEFEVSFGIFIIPIFIALLLIFEASRKKLLTLKGIVFLLLGFLIPLLPRILFEIRHQFMQTKTLLSFFLKPKLHNPKAFIDVFNDRTMLFWSYFKSIFFNYSSVIALIVIVFIIFTLIKLRKKLTKYVFINLFLFLTILLFSVSLLYKDNFWSNYYEGIQYIFLFIIVSFYYLLSKNFKLFFPVILVLFIGISLFVFVKEIKNNNIVIKDFKAIDLAVNYLYDQTGKKDFCLRVYTAPVVPYTYDYLASYYSKIYKINRPIADFIDNKCWFIIEKDPFEFRVEKWKQENIPSQGKKLSFHKINKDIMIELWQQ